MNITIFTSINHILHGLSSCDQVFEGKTALEKQTLSSFSERFLISLVHMAVRLQAVAIMLFAMLSANSVCGK